eukprot:scaffold4998_cov72-Phaeocystis_antarctica.AAC.3
MPWTWPTGVAAAHYRPSSANIPCLVVKAAEPIKVGRGQCGMRDDLQDVALQRQHENPASLQRVGVHVVAVGVLCWVSLDEVEAVLRKAKVLRRPPLTRD